MDKLELEPCPFCGSGCSSLFVGKGGAGLFFVECAMSDGGCGAAGPVEISEKDAVEAWNRRTSHKRD